MSGLVPGPFCVEFACSPRVHPGSPHRTPTTKTCKKNRCSTVLSLTKTGLSTWTWSPGAALLAAHCSWLSLGEDARMGKSRRSIPPTHLIACVCVCVLCVSPLTLVCKISACRVANKQDHGPLVWRGDVNSGVSIQLFISVCGGAMLLHTQQWSLHPALHQDFSEQWRV